MSAVRFRPRPPNMKPQIRNDLGLFCLCATTPRIPVKSMKANWLGDLVRGMVTMSCLCRDSSSPAFVVMYRRRKRSRRHGARWRSVAVRSQDRASTPRHRSAPLHTDQASRCVSGQKNPMRFLSRPRLQRGDIRREYGWLQSCIWRGCRNSALPLASVRSACAGHPRCP